MDNETAAQLRVLDVGAGNGMVGEELDRMGAKHIVGVDIIPEAAEAAQRTGRASTTTTSWST